MKGFTAGRVCWCLGVSAAALTAGMPMAAAQTSSSAASPMAAAPQSDSPRAAGAANAQSQVQGGDATPGSTVPAGQTAPDSPAGVPSGAPAQTSGSDIVVTGSRLTNGMRTPTPVTVTTSAELLQAAPNNLADGLTRLPAFNGSTSTSSPASNATTGTIGQNLLNLRGLGDNRNLVLLDGRRIVATNTDFAVDINTLPQSLVSRVDVVTGGASAAYGSDAVAGVVNFVLDTKFTGLKGEASGGISTYGDLPSQKVSLTGGVSLLGDRLHVVASAQAFRQDGLAGRPPNPRNWFYNAPGLIPNVLSTTPANLVVPNIRSSIGSDGGLITAGPLKGTNFLANGATAAFDYGYDSGTGFQSGGDGSRVNFSFTPEQSRHNEFIHASFDVSNRVTVYGEYSFAYSRTLALNNSQGFTGSQYAFTIYNDNPYLPASVSTAMAANRITNFKLGRYLADFPEFSILTTSRVFRQAAGVKGSNLFGLPSWNWEVSYSAGQTHQYLAENDLANIHNIYAAVDAVRNPQSGQIVCRSQYYTTAGVFVPGGTGLNAGCVPLNVLGVGTASQDAINYINGTSFKNLTLHQEVAAAKLSGDFGSFSLGAGPISFATGFEYRRESAFQTADAVSGSVVDFTGIRGGPTALAGRVGGYRFYNPLPFQGAQNVKEGFLEIGVPIFKDRPFAESLTADGAVRYTSYSLAGSVTTWKAGLEYTPFGGLRLRGTVSRDIRAPNLLELFNTALQNSNNVLYPSSANGTTTNSLQTTTGNPGLRPEKALTQTYGVVLTPGFLPGFSLSVDYYKIRLTDAIGTLTAQNEVDYCAAGQASYCSLISVVGGVVKIQLSPLNLNLIQNEGIDFEATYRTRMFGNPLNLRLLANHGIANFSQAPNAVPLYVLGSAISPSWKAQLQAQYTVNSFSVFANERFISAVMMDPNKVEGVFTNNNHVPPVFYTDLTLNYDVKLRQSNVQLFLSIENLFDRNPPIDVVPPSSTSSPTSPAYDRIGRYITGGLRFRF